MDFMGKLLLLLSASPWLAAQDPNAQIPAPAGTAVFRAGVAMVRVDAQVINGRQVVAGLDRDSFRVLDEGAEQPIEYFARDSEPLSLLLLLDVSGSIRRRLQEMAAAARKALDALGEADRVAVMFFGRTTKVAQELTKDRVAAAKAIAEALTEKSVGSGTLINPALLDAARYLGAEGLDRVGRRAIVILTDNQGLNYQTPDQMVLEALYSADAVLNAIVTPDARPPDTPPPGVKLNPDFSPSDVFRIARDTGGEVLRAERAGETFREMLERIRLRYSLHYRAPDAAVPGTVRRIQVELSPAARKRYPKAEVRARAGYLIPK
jgi:VWFA-related protein